MAEESGIEEEAPAVRAEVLCAGLSLLACLLSCARFFMMAEGSESAASGEGFCAVFCIARARLRSRLSWPGEGRRAF